MTWRELSLALAGDIDTVAVLFVCCQLAIRNEGLRFVIGKVTFSFQDLFSLNYFPNDSREASGRAELRANLRPILDNLSHILGFVGVRNSALRWSYVHDGLTFESSSTTHIRRFPADTANPCLICETDTGAL